MSGLGLVTTQSLGSARAYVPEGETDNKRECLMWGGEKW